MPAAASAAPGVGARRTGGANDGRGDGKSDGKGDGKGDGADDEAVDWRGLERMNDAGNSIRRDKPATSPIEHLVANAPYRVQVATSDGRSIRITDAFTLERSRIYQGAPVLGFAFSGDGATLYAVVGGASDVEVLAIDVGSASQRRLGRLKLSAGEVVAHIEGGGGRGELRAIVSLAAGKATKGGCATYQHWRRFRFRQADGAETRVESLKGPPDVSSGLRRRAVSPNTRLNVELGSTLIAHGRFGSTQHHRLNAGALPADPVGFVWMRDSSGVVVGHKRPTKAGCAHRLGAVAYRQTAAAGPAWQAWEMPSDLEIVRGDLDGDGPQMAEDGMRLLAVGRHGVFLVEPVPRFRGKVSLITPPSTVWPLLRPGVQGLAQGAGSLRHTEILLEQGDLEGAARQASIGGAGAPAADRQRLIARIAKLRAVRARRAAELGVRECELMATCVGQAAEPTQGDAAAEGSAEATETDASVDPKPPSE